jgi:hypothetical protein
VSIRVYLFLTGWACIAFAMHPTLRQKLKGLIYLDLPGFGLIWFDLV